MPVASVVTAYYKGQKYIGRTLESVQKQTMVDWEHIVMDDGSPESCMEVIAAYAARDLRLKVFRQPNGGPENARNNGYRACSRESQYVLFLDHDDCLEPTALKTMVQYLESHPEAGMVYCAAHWIDSDDNIIGNGTTGQPAMRYVPRGLGVRRLSDDVPETPLECFMGYFQAVPSTCLFRCSLYEQAGGWDEGLRGESRRGTYEDKDLIIRCVLLAPIHYIPEVLVRYRRHADNVSNLPWDAKAFHAKWKQKKNLSVEQAKKVRRAFRFDHRLSAHLQFQGAREEFGRGRYQQGWIFSLQGIKKICKLAASFLPDTLVSRLT